MRTALVFGAVVGMLTVAVPRAIATAGEAGLSQSGLRPRSQGGAAVERADTEGVLLLEGGAPIDAINVVATLGTVLRSRGFRPEVVAEVQSRYFGYLIDRRQRDGRWEFTGPLQAFTARYGSSRTTGWPDRTAFLYEDSRAGAALAAAVRPAGNVPEAANLRIYYRPDRVGFEAGRYQTQDALLLVYLDPDSGRQSTYVYRPEGDGYQLYRYAPARIPSRPSETSVVSRMAVATTDTIRIQVFITSVSVPVPRHTYSAGLFRAFGGRNYEGTATPMGPPIRFEGLSRQEGTAPFAAALEAHQEGRLLSDKEFADVHRFIRHVHRYLVETPEAGAS